MNHRMWTAVALLAAAVPALHAQTPSPPKDDKYAPELKTLTAAFGQGRTAVIAAYQKAPEKDRMKVYTDGMAKLSKDLGPKFLALASKAKGTTSGLRARMQHFNMASGPGMKPAELMKLAQEIVKLEAKNPDMARALSQIGGLRDMTEQPAEKSKIVAMMQEVETKSPFPGVKAQAMYERGQTLYSLGKKDDALALLKSVTTKYATTAAANEAKGTIFELENLQVGKVAPDFEAKDEKDTAFKLSEYRGKVVVVDFWGFW